MRFVEFLGVPGAGTTTIYRELVKRPIVVGLDQAVLACLAQSGDDSITRLIARLVNNPRNPVWRRTYARSTDRFQALSHFLSRQSELMSAVLEATSERAHLNHRQDRVLDWILNLGARFQLASEWAEESHLVAIDEGFSQRGIALFAYEFRSEHQGLLDRYLSRSPRPTVLIVVDTPMEVCASRLDERGWSERLTNASRAERMAFLEGAASVVDAAVEKSRDQTSIVRVSGTADPDSNIAEIITRLSTLDRDDADSVGT